MNIESNQRLQSECKINENQQTQYMISKPYSQTAYQTAPA